MCVCVSVLGYVVKRRVYGLVSLGVVIVLLVVNVLKYFCNFLVNLGFFSF